MLSQNKIKAQIVFSGCGGMYNYVLGIASIIQENFDLTNVVIGSASAGCFPGLFLGLDLDIVELFETFNIELCSKVNSYRFGAIGVWNTIVKYYTMKKLPYDAYKRVSNKLFISLSKISLFSLSNCIVSNFTSNEDLVDCIMASSFVPIFDLFKLGATFRNELYMDGVLTNNSPIPYPPLTVPILNIDYNMWRFGKKTWKAVYVYTDEKYIRQLFKLGREDALSHLDDLAKILPRKIKN